MAWFERYLSPDDLTSALGYVVIVIVAHLSNRNLPLAAASFFGSGLLSIFWLASRSVRERNAERRPNVRVALWALVALVSAAVFLTA